MKALENLCRPNLPTKPDPTILNYTSMLAQTWSASIYVCAQEPSFEEEKKSHEFLYARKHIIICALCY